MVRPAAAYVWCSTGISQLTSLIWGMHFQQRKHTLMGLATHHRITFINITAINMYIWVHIASNSIDLVEHHTSMQAFIHGISASFEWLQYS